MIDKKGILTALKKNQFCVLSTVSTTAKPQVAVMSYTIKDDFTFLMSTEPTTRKVTNITTNNQSSVLIGGLDGSSEIQIDGLVRFLSDAEVSDAKNYIFSVHPELKDYISVNHKIIEFKPTWLRYSDFSISPAEIFELTDFT
ncbi:MAG: pyridoxamine 5'-phosphate oxidase family protein [Candidatus Moranbacteria bacterium]|nr:pyridoxamine 5'-phosphate oxidase family protein [Candidatus Moranbacteria bacterium]